MASEREGIGYSNWIAATLGLLLAILIAGVSGRLGWPVTTAVVITALAGPKVSTLPMFARRPAPLGFLVFVVDLAVILTTRATTGRI
jgi:hypothetical protein